MFVVVIIPVLTQLYATSWPTSATDNSLCDFTDEDRIHAPILSLSIDPLTLYKDRALSPPTALNTDNTNSTVTHNQSTAKDMHFFTVAHKARLWTVRLEPPSAKRHRRNCPLTKQQSESSTKPLSVVAAEKNHSKQLSVVKRRLIEQLGKLSGARHVVCFVVLFRDFSGLFSCGSRLVFVLFL